MVGPTGVGPTGVGFIEQASHLWFFQYNRASAQLSGGQPWSIMIEVLTRGTDTYVTGSRLESSTARLK